MLQGQISVWEWLELLKTNEETIKINSLDDITYITLNVEDLKINESIKLSVTDFDTIKFNHVSLRNVFLVELISYGDAISVIAYANINDVTTLEIASFYVHENVSSLKISIRDMACKSINFMMNPIDTKIKEVI